MLNRDTIICKIDCKIASLGKEWAIRERLGRKDPIIYQKKIMELYAYKVFMVTEQEVDEKDLSKVISNALKTINNV
jgi:hypothetical protein